MLLAFPQVISNWHGTWFFIDIVLHLNFKIDMNRVFRHLCLTLLVFSIYQPLSSQSFTISGFLTSNETGEVLVGAYVFCPQTGSGAVSNNYGYYAISIPYGTKNILYMSEGFYAKVDTTRIQANKQVDVGLSPMDEDGIQTDPFFNVGVEDETESGDEESDSSGAPLKVRIRNSYQVNQLITYVLERNFKVIDRIENGFVEVPGIQISRMPSLGGEIDVGRSIKHLPGVMPGTELTNGMYVRGGGQDQNLVLIDGVPIYNMNHAFGFYSIFNSEAINSINLTKSGFSARHGGRLSAITDVVMKEGNAQGIHGIFLQSLVAFTLDLNGPLSSDGRTTFALSARRSHWDLLIFRPISTDSSKFHYTFYDLSMKVCHRIDKKNKLFFSLYSNRDRFYTFDKSSTTINNNPVLNEDEFDLRWGNFAGSFKWNRVINDKLFSNLSLMYSQYQSVIELNFASEYDSAGVKDVSRIDFKYINLIRDMQAGLHFDYMADRRNTVRFGTQLSLKGFLPGSTATKYTNNGVVSNDTFFGVSSSIPTQELALYAEDEIKLSNDMRLTAGGRLVTYFYKNEQSLFFEPRLSFNRKFQNQFAIKGSYTMMNQNLHLLADNINSNLIALNFDRWVPATGQARSQRAQQVTLGFSKPYKNDWEFSVEAYYKWFDRILEIKEGADINGGILTSNEWESKVLTGKGWNYGVETFLHKRRGAFTGWISYALSWATRNTPTVNRGQDYYYQFDRRHYVNIVAQTRINEKYSASFNVVFSTGNVQSVPIGKYLDINGNVVYDYTEKNNYRLANTFRVDFGLNKIRDQSWGAESGYRFSIYNVFARNNPAYVYIDNSNAKPQAYQRGFLSFIPGITYYVKF